MLEHLTGHFRILLKEFDGTSCPLCAVVKIRELDQIERVQAKRQSASALSGTHLSMALEQADGLVARARETRDAINNALDGGPRCGVCGVLSRVESRLANSVRRLDGRTRFMIALQSAPLFCQKHASLVFIAGSAPTFAEVQRAKLAHLRDALARAAQVNSEAVEPLIAIALAYFGRSGPEEVRPEMEESSPSGEEASDLERWDEQRHFKRLAMLESEVAALRYRNAMLSEENRRLKLAHAAVQALREDLERDRADLMAKKNSGDSDGIKSSNRH